MIHLITYTLNYIQGILKVSLYKEIRKKYTTSRINLFTSTTLQILQNILQVTAIVRDDYGSSSQINLFTSCKIPGITRAQKLTM